MHAVKLNANGQIILMSMILSGVLTSANRTMVNQQLLLPFRNQQQLTSPNSAHMSRVCCLACGPPEPFLKPLTTTVLPSLLGLAKPGGCPEWADVLGLPCRRPCPVMNAWPAAAG